MRGFRPFTPGLRPSPLLHPGRGSSTLLSAPLPPHPRCQILGCFRLFSGPFWSVWGIQPSAFVPLRAAPQAFHATNSALRRVPRVPDAYVWGPRPTCAGCSGRNGNVKWRCSCSCSCSLLMYLFTGRGGQQVKALIILDINSVGIAFHQVSYLRLSLGVNRYGGQGVS